MDLKKYIYDIPNFPSEGILFRDITPLLDDSDAFNYTVNKMMEIAKSFGATKIVSPEARGFLFGTPVAYGLNVGFVPVRKPGKLPRETIMQKYTLEYGTNTLAMHADAIKKGDKVVIVDDLLATGGTVLAAARLVEELGGEVVGMVFAIELVDLNGKKVLEEYNIESLIKY